MNSFFSSSLHASPLCCLLLIPSLVVSPLLAQSPLPVSSPAPSANAGPVAPGSALDNTDLQVHIVEGAAQEAQVDSTPAKGLIVSVTNAAGAAVPDAAVALRLPDSGASGTFADGSHAAVAYTDGSGRAQFTGLHWNQTPGTVTMRVTATKGTSHAALLMNQTLSSLPAASEPAPKQADLSPTPAAVLRPAQLATPLQPPVQALTPAPAQKLAQNMPQTLAQLPSQTGASPAADVPLTPIPPPTKPEPAVTVTGASPDSTHHSSRTKWIILAAVVAAGAGAGIALAGKGKSSSSTASAITIGTPSVSVGAPTH
jgi:hypothetical protein